ncbi:N-acetyltransferase family protein [Deinococcus sp.]|uniref:GNAT family N-acetyltransferase n=1 Tax=Deinococcus sp. TaxID=47478 RepID=UPI003C7C6536
MERAAEQGAEGRQPSGDVLTGLHLRPATPADAPGLAAMHVAGWAETYRGLMPTTFLAQMTSPAMHERRAAHWERTLAERLETVTVAEQGGRVVAFTGAGATRPHTVIPGDYDAELYTLYALKRVHGLGLGRALLRASAAALHAQGYAGLALWVLDVNPSRAFYTHLGGAELGRKTEEVPGGVLTEVALGWRDLRVLL